MARILMCTINYRPEMISTGKYAYELAEYLAAAGHDVEVVTTVPHYPGWYARPPYSNRRYLSETINGVRVHRAPMYLNTNASGLIRLVMPLTFAIASAPVLLWRAIRARPDVVVVVQPPFFAAPVALLAGLLAGAGTLHHVQDIEIDAALAVGHISGGGPLLRAAYALERFVMRRFDRIVTISTKMRDRLIAKGVAAQRVGLVRNWVDSTAIRPLGRPSDYRAELGIPDDRFVVQYSGQLGKKQALHLITEAAALLRDDPRFCFVIAGDGPERPAIEAAARDLPNLRLLPLQPTERMCEFLNLADCHILPQEAGVSELVLPSKLGGMLASGKRILITADADSELHEFVGDGAVFTPPGEAAPVAAALRRMVGTPDENPERRQACAALLDSRTVLPAFEREILALARD